MERSEFQAGKLASAKAQGQRSTRCGGGLLIDSRDRAEGSCQAIVKHKSRKEVVHQMLRSMILWFML